MCSCGSDCVPHACPPAYLSEYLSACVPACPPVRLSAVCHAALQPARQQRATDLRAGAQGSVGGEDKHARLLADWCEGIKGSCFCFSARLVKLTGLQNLQVAACL